MHKNTGGKPPVLKKCLHLPDICSFAVQQFLGYGADPVILMRILVEIFQPFDHAFGIPLDHHIRNFRIAISTGQLHPCHSVCQEPLGRIQFPQFPAPLAGDRMGFPFNAIIFPELGLQCFSESGTHAGIQHAADANLAHLCGF